MNQNGTALMGRDTSIGQLPSEQESEDLYGSDEERSPLVRSVAEYVKLIDDNTKKEGEK